MTLIDIGYKQFSVPGRTPKRGVGRSNRLGDGRKHRKCEGFRCFSFFTIRSVFLINMEVVFLMLNKNYED